MYSLHSQHLNRAEIQQKLFSTVVIDTILVVVDPHVSIAIHSQTLHLFHNRAIEGHQIEYQSLLDASTFRH